MKVVRMNKGDWGKVRAFFDLKTSEGFILKGFKYIEGISGLFVGYPSQKGSDNEYFDTIMADKQLKNEVNALAHQVYENEQNFLDGNMYVHEDVKKKAENVQMETHDEDIPF